MSSTCIELSGPAASMAAVSPGELRKRKPVLCRKRLLRRAAVGIAGTGWALFGGAHLGHATKPQQAAASTPSLDVALQDGSLRIGGLSGSAPGTAWIPFANTPVLHHLDQPYAIANDSASWQFTADVRERLPLFQASFELAGLRSGLDWRLLAAMGYQESSWDPNAVSPTGVRGIMMLTLDTADELDVDRDNPAEAINGGAAYFQQILDRLPPQIHEPDRTAMALAAYNQGLGHLYDARRLAVQLGGDPNRWRDVKSALPLLAEERWFSQTRHGYARGQEAVRFVSRVNGYYNMLSSLSSDATASMVASGGM